MIPNLRTRVASILKSLNEGAYEREETIALSLLSALAGESIFLLGLPGVGKSMVARRLKLAFQNASSFEYLMSRFSTPDEIFGPVSISKLKDSDLYERMIGGYLPTADIVFLDEIWKAGPAIQNALLTVLNERIYHNGTADLHIPLKAIISASNELPAEGEGLEALWDRFLVRYIVNPIRNKKNFEKLLFKKQVACTVDSNLPFSEEDLLDIQKEGEDINVPQQVFDLLCAIRDALSAAKTDAEENNDGETITPPYVSDRRWRKIIGVLRMSALLNGRKAVDLSDCLLLEHMLWDNDMQIPSVKEMIGKAVAMQIKKNINIAGSDLAGTLPGVPMGKLISPDGKHYVFTASNEDIKILITDYDKLSSQVMYADITSDSHLLLSDKKAPFSVQKLYEGTITINSFTYYLHHTSALKSGSADFFADNLVRNSNIRFTSLDAEISNNLFLKPPKEYVELNAAHSKTNENFKKLKYE